jgi:transcriptional regulator with XRE-family HTH domain
MANSPLNEALAAFAAELARWRMERGLSKKQLARMMGFDPSYVSHIEGQRHRPTEDFARRAERVLRSENAIWRQFVRYDYLRRRSPGGPTLDVEPVPHGIHDVTVEVEEEITSLSYDRGWYHCSMIHRLVNRGSKPVTRHIVQVDVDRSPEGAEPPAPDQRKASSIWDDLQFHAALGIDRRDPIKWVPPRSRAAFDEILLLFESADVPMPLYPDQRTTVACSYRLPGRGNDSWFERDIRTPTWRLRVRLDFPADLEPVVWGEQTSLAMESALPDPSVRPVDDAGRLEFEWQVENPMLLTHFRFGWRFQASSAGC